MDSIAPPFPVRSSRLGFHYFPDTVHFRDSDLAKWVPELTAMGISWLVIQSPLDRAIPEKFIRGLVEAGIEPLVDFNISLSTPTAISDLTLLFKAYARWGVHGVLLYKRPNVFQAWTKATWAREDLVERFLDHFLPLASAALAEGLTPILPPLEPGGSYWDTSFLKSMLTSIVRRNPGGLLEKLVIGAYAYTYHHELDWGAGGAQTWRDTRPYATPPGRQDQIGFRLMDWYREISLAVLGRECPIILFGAGAPTGPHGQPGTAYSPQEHRQVQLDIARLMALPSTAPLGDSASQISPLPADIIACNFWQLAAQEDAPGAAQAWFQEEVDFSATIQALKDEHLTVLRSSGSAEKTVDAQHPIEHYLLLPTYEWGIADWHLEVIRPYVKKYLPTIGFSIEEAQFARTVTLIGLSDSYSEAQVEKLILSGCRIDRIVGDGTSIATQLAER